MADERDIDETFDLGARERARTAIAEAHARKEQQLDADYLWLIQSRAGRNVMWDIIAPMWRASFDGTREGTDFREGERNVALRVWARLVRVAPVLAPKIIEENLQ